VPAALHQSIKGARACHAVPSRDSPTEGDSCEFSSHFYFSPCFLTAAFFNEICYSIHEVACLPSVDEVDKSLLLSSHAHESIEEDGDGEFPLLFISPHSTLFLTAFFPIKLLSLRPAGCLPSVYKSNKCSYCHHLFACRMEKAVTVSSPLIFIPTLWHFSQTQFNYYSVSCAGCPPAVNRGNKGLLPPSPPMRCVEKVFQMFSHSIVFSQIVIQ
jgi:hypothetical protein